jgi:hypothetical protein
VEGKNVVSEQKSLLTGNVEKLVFQQQGKNREMFVEE